VANNAGGSAAADRLGAARYDDDEHLYVVSHADTIGEPRDAIPQFVLHRPLRALSSIVLHQADRFHSATFDLRRLESEPP
jgi:hypothetical protein